MTITDTVLVKQPHGLHLRAAVKLILLSRKYRSRITLKKGGTLADAHSILSIMNLGASQGTELEVVSEGDDAGEALAEVRDFFDHPQSWS